MEATASLHHVVVARASLHHMHYKKRMLALLPFTHVHHCCRASGGSPTETAGRSPAHHTRAHLLALNGLQAEACTAGHLLTCIALCTAVAASLHEDHD